MGKTVQGIIIDRILSDVEKEGSMPWQRPYKMYNSFNYFSLNTYKGINRLILPFGEYLTANQINEYNKAHNEDYRFQKGIQWFPVVFFKPDIKEISLKALKSIFPSEDIPTGKSDKPTFIGRDLYWVYYYESGKYFKRRNVLRYYNVADRKYFKNSKGECLPSRIDTGDVEILLSKPKDVIDSYIARSGVNMGETLSSPNYQKIPDLVEMNYTCKGNEFYSTLFHELAHSTGHEKRLNREGVVSNKSSNDLYAKEECIAEITACLCCAECGIYSLETSCTSAYSNNIAYLSYWKKKVKDWGKDFIYLVSEADKAFNMILDFKEE